MPYYIDGSNLLGALGVNRESSESKLTLVRMLAAFARARRTKVVCWFDGGDPGSFASHVGSVSVRFAHPRSADHCIGDQVASSTAPCTVVTSDRALGNRLRSRRVTVTTSLEFKRLLEEIPQSDDSSGLSSDWEAYFSDPKNRNV